MTTSTHTFPGSISPTHYIGFGGAGCNVVELLHKKGNSGSFTCITHPVRPNQAAEIDFVHFIPPGEIFFHNGEELFRRSDPDTPLIVPPEVEVIFDNPGRFVLIAGLGGYTGTNMMEKFACQLHDHNIPFTAIASVPLRFEGTKRRKTARAAINRLRHLNNIHYLELETIAISNGNLPISTAFALADEMMVEMVVERKLSRAAG
jgi:cell division GTPase FtsZ